MQKNCRASYCLGQWKHYSVWLCRLTGWSKCAPSEAISQYQWWFWVKKNYRTFTGQNRRKYNNFYHAKYCIHYYLVWVITIAIHYLGLLAFTEHQFHASVSEFVSMNVQQQCYMLTIKQGLGRSHSRWWILPILNTNLCNIYALKKIILTLCKKYRNYRTFLETYRKIQDRKKIQDKYRNTGRKTITAIFSITLFPSWNVAAGTANPHADIRYE